MREMEAVHIVLSSEGRTVTIHATGVLSVSDLAVAAGGDGTSVVLEKRVPKGVRLTRLAFLGGLAPSLAGPSPKATAKDRVEGEERVFTVSATGLTQPAPDEGAATSCSGIASNATLLSYTLEGLVLDPDRSPQVRLTCVPGTVKAGKPARLKVRARVKLSEARPGSVALNVPNVLAGSMARLGPAPEGGRVIERAPATIVAWPLDPNAGTDAQTFECSVDITPGLTGQIVLENALEVRLSTPGLPLAGLAGAASSGVPTQRIMVWHVPLVFRVGE